MVVDSLNDCEKNIREANRVEKKRKDKGLDWIVEKEGRKEKEGKKQRE